MLRVCESEQTYVSESTQRAQFLSILKQVQVSPQLKLQLYHCGLRRCSAAFSVDLLKAEVDAQGVQRN
jgi:hypothetical protein